MEAIRRSLNGNAVSERGQILASLPAKHVKRRRSDYRSGHFSQSDFERFFSVRSAQVAYAERRQQRAAEQLGVFRPGRTIILLERFLDWHRFVQGRNRIQTG